MKFPSDIRLQITSRCNLNCQHCFTSSRIQSNNGELNNDKFLSLVDQIVDQRTKALSITGGEPLLRKDLVLRILERLNGHPAVTTLNTSGWFVNMKMAKKLKEAGLQKVQISLDSHEPKTHDRFRGMKGSHTRAMRAVVNCVKVGLKTLIRTTITPFNFDSMPEILDLILTKGSQGLVVKPLIPSGRGLQMDEPLTNEQHKRAIIDLIDMIRMDSRVSQEYVRFLSPCLPFLIDSDFAVNAEKCECGERLAFITSMGDVQPCGYTHRVLGNILEMPLSSIWTESRFLKNWQENRISGKCKSCGFVQTCEGGCRAAAYETTGRLDVPDPMCWRREQH